MAAILIVEDDRTTNDLISDYLSDAGHSTHQVYDARFRLHCRCRNSVVLAQPSLFFKQATLGCQGFIALSGIVTADTVLKSLYFFSVLLTGCGSRFHSSPALFKGFRLQKKEH